jgi:MSHA biogenesis protein MshN
MSIINKMLQELDRRHALPAGATVPATGSPAGRRPKHREWFWRTIALLIAIALGWVAWLAYQLWPRPIATEAAYTSEQARPKSAEAPRLPQPTSAPPPAPAVAAQPSEPAAVAPAPETPAPPAPPPAASAPVQGDPRLSPSAEQLRLAQSIQTPIVERPVRQAKRPAPSAGTTAPVITKEETKVERRDRATSAAERAENEFRHGADLLKLGRASDAEVHFAKALELDGGHRGARQALVAMHLERGRLEVAQRLLQEGLALNSAQPEFAVALARIFVEKKDLKGALGALDAAPGAAAAPDYQLMRATVLQRLGRHGEAADFYKAALTQQPGQPQAWVGLGISLQALNRRPEASEAFKRALAAGPITPEMKTFAEQRMRALH